MPSSERRAKKRSREFAGGAEGCRTITTFFAKPGDRQSTEDTRSNVTDEIGERESDGQTTIDSVTTTTTLSLVSTGDSVAVSGAEAQGAKTTNIGDEQPRSTKKSKHSVGREAVLNLNFDWLLMKNEWCNEEKGDVPVLYCSLCRKHKTYAPNGNKTWVDVGFKTLRKDRIKDHAVSDQHKAAVLLQKQHELNACRDLQIAKEEKSVADNLIEVVFYLAQNNLPLDQFPKLVDLCIKTGSKNLSATRQSGNATYTSPGSIHSLLEAVSEAVDNFLMPQILNSPTFSLMVDEVCDRSVTKNLGVIIKFINDDGEPMMNFLSDKEMVRSTGLDIKTATLAVLEEKNLPPKNCTNLTSDGASSFAGKNNGAAALLKEDMPNAIVIHCHDHRLALACRDAFKTIPCLDSVSEGLDSLFKFYKYSSVSAATLRSLQDLYHQAHWRIQQAKHHRWLSYDKAVTVVLQGLPLLREDLENASSAEQADQFTAKHRNDANALYKFITQEKNLRILCLLGDILPQLADLSLVFQRRSVDLTYIQPKLQSTLATIESRREVLGPWESRLAENRDTHFVVTKFNCSKKDFDTSVKAPFLDSLKKKLTERFVNVEVVSLLGTLAIPLDILDSLPPLYRHEEVKSLARHFHLDEFTLLQEWIAWLEFVQSLDFSQSNCNASSLAVFGKLLLQRNSASSQDLASSYPGLTYLYSVTNTLALSSAEVERLFSHVKIVKTDKRSTLSNKCLNFILNIKLNVQKEFEGTIKSEAAKLWLQKKQRRFGRYVSI